MPGPTTHPLLTPADVRRLLSAHGLAPRKSSGQNFVVDPNTVRKVVRDAGITPGTLVCEVGPGLGSLTLALRQAGARVVAVEIDAGLVRALRDVVGGDGDVRIVHADALRVDFAALLGGRPAVLVANLPYHVATPIVMRALARAAFTDIFVMVQREVGQRWAAHVGDPLYGAVSVKVRAQAEARIRATVSRAAFYPVPNVESVTVSLKPRPWMMPVRRERLFAVVETGFAQRRKRLRNALATGGHTPAAIEAALVRAGLNPAARAEELDLDAWAALTAALVMSTS
ncbi:MAG: 16S rRNA (adenine(1518)-N(6)/adenine(1519)-N(6))-dimethyltransferase RsmA [Egibacteraceae bacterium]